MSSSYWWKRGSRSRASQASQGERDRAREQDAARVSSVVEALEAEIAEDSWKLLSGGRSNGAGCAGPGRMV